MIITFDELAEVRRRHGNQKVVLTSGTFDLLHVGHLNFLNQVKSFGDVVVVMLSGDGRVKARKGPARPIFSEDDRAKMLDGFKSVDYVFIDPSMLDPEQDDPIHEEIIKRLRPDFYVTDGPDPRFLDLIDKSKFIILDRDDMENSKGGKRISSSAIIESIQASPQN